tara:strand:- start:14 stop:1219 length:1206 start_codon:yes stop_codon:yes gene_type:complete
VFQKSGSATIDTLVPTEINENLGIIEFYGVNNAGTPAKKMGAYILVEQDAAKDATAVPTRLIFATSDDDDNGSPTERLRIDDAGIVSVKHATEGIFRVYRDTIYSEFAQNSSGGVITIDKADGDAGVQLQSYGDSFFNGGKVGIGTATPIGAVTIEQLTADIPAITFMSTDAVTHGFTSQSVGGITLDTNTYGNILKGSGGNGGLRIDGYSEYEYRGILIQGQCDDAVRTSKNTTGFGAVSIVGTGISSNDAATVGSNGNILDISDNHVVRFIFDAEGSFHADVESTTFDHYNDASLVRAFDLSHGKDVIASKFDDFIDYNHETLAELKLVGREEDGTPNKFVNVTKMQQLHNGAIWQQYTELQKMKELMYDTMVELMGKEKADKKLNSHDIRLLDKGLLN